MDGNRLTPPRPFNRFGYLRNFVQKLIKSPKSKLLNIISTQMCELSKGVRCLWRLFPFMFRTYAYLAVYLFYRATLWLDCDLLTKTFKYKPGIPASAKSSFSSCVPIFSILSKLIWFSANINITCYTNLEHLVIFVALIAVFYWVKVTREREHWNTRALKQNGKIAMETIKRTGIQKIINGK